MSTAHKITARGYPVTARAYITDDGEIHKDSNSLQNHPNARQMRALVVLSAAVGWFGSVIALVQLIARRVCFHAEAAKLDAAIAANLKELGYGG